ncbi:hypothetical protein SprV_0100180500 [Sparganum proliferum]
MLLDAYSSKRPLIRIIYRTDGQILITGHMNAPTRLSTTSVHDLFFAKAYGLNAAAEPNILWSMSLLTAGYAKFGLHINRDEAVVTHQPSRNAEYNDFRITVNGIQQKPLGNLDYLDNLLFSSIKIDDKKAHEISGAG